MSPEQPSRGPYRVCGLLGRGTMGAVYKAEHSTSGLLVALKTVKVPWAALLPMVRREIRALQRLHHPGVVRILDSGAEAGVPWYAMELIEGPTLREVGLPAGRLSSAQDRASLLDILMRLCGALAYVHGEGIVHRDLKPENVIVRADGQPVLVDFGVVAELAGALGRETLSFEAGAAGTPLYMAPEQLRGELVDARADLYALGCMTFELLCGTPPFTGTAKQVREAQLQAEPRALSDLAPWVPAELSELVGRLLRKEPRERLGYASDVAAVLERLGARAAPSPGPKAYLYRPGLVGREGPLEVLEAHLEVLEQGRGGLLLIGGESGVGKTRLLVELARRAGRRQVRVLAGECLPGAASESQQDASGLATRSSRRTALQESARAPRGRSDRSPSFSGASIPLEALRKPLQALGDWCRQQGADQTRHVLGRHGKLLGRYEASFLELEGLTAAPEPVDLPPKAARLRLFGTLIEVFRTWTAERHLLLVLDDLQWADELTLSFLEHLLRTAFAEAADDLPLLVVGAYRTEEAGEGLRRLLEAPGTRHLPLERLEDEALGSMVRDMLALGQPAPAFERFLARQTEGNPLFAGEYLRTAVAEGVLYRDAQGRWQVAEPGEQQATEAVFKSLPLPGALRELLARRLEGLGDGARRLLEAASVVGREADEELLGRMTPASEAKRMEAARELLARQIFGAGAEGLRFSHDKLREVTYDSLTPRRRRSLHRAAAKAIEARFGPESAEHQVTLGHHWEQSGAAARARPCYLAAARWAVTRYAHSEAERLYRAILALSDAAAPETAVVRNELSLKVLAIQGRNAEALEEHALALEGARALGDRRAEAEALYGLGGAHFQLGQMGEAHVFFEQVLPVLRELGDERGEARALRRLAELHFMQGRAEEAQGLLEQVLRMSRRAGDLETEERVLGTLAGMCLRLGRRAEARTLFEQALELAKKTGHRQDEGWLLGHLAILCQEEGRPQAARELYEKALLLHREVGDRDFEGSTLSNLGGLEQAQGCLAEARIRFEEALRVFRELGNRRFEGMVAGNLGGLYRTEGCLEEAREALGQALALLGPVGEQRSLAFALQELGRVELAEGRFEEAREPLERALTLARAMREPSVEATALLAAAQLQEAEGAPEAARTSCEQALLLYRGLGDRRSEGVALLGLGRVERLAGAAARAEDLARQAESRLEEFGDPLELARCLAERGHIELAQGKPAHELLRQARALALPARIGARSDCGMALARLDRAVQSFEAGRPLVRGESAEDLPEALRRRIQEQGLR